MTILPLKFIICTTQSTASVCYELVRCHGLSWFVLPLAQRYTTAAQSQLRSVYRRRHHDYGVHYNNATKAADHNVGADFSHYWNISDISVMWGVNHLNCSRLGQPPLIWNSLTSFAEVHREKAAQKPVSTLLATSTFQLFKNKDTLKILPKYVKQNIPMNLGSSMRSEKCIVAFGALWVAEKE